MQGLVQGRDPSGEERRSGATPCGTSRARHSFPRRTRELARLLVEGYHAAPAERISAQALSAGDEEKGDEDHRQRRIVGGYDALVDWLRAGLDPARVSLRLRAAATEVRWERGRVSVTARVGTGAATETFAARASILALPLAVLKAPAEE